MADREGFDRAGCGNSFGGLEVLGSRFEGETQRLVELSPRGTLARLLEVLGTVRLGILGTGYSGALSGPLIVPRGTIGLAAVGNADDAGGGLGYRNGIGQVEVIVKYCWHYCYCRCDDDHTLTGAGCRGLDGRVHLIDGAEGDGVEGAVRRHRLDALGPDFCGDGERADGFAEERGFLPLGFCEGDGDFGVKELDGQAGETGAGAEVEQRVGRTDVGGGEEALAEVAADDLLGRADGGEVDSGVPFLDEVEVEG